MSLVVASGQSELIAGLISANAIAGTSTFDVSTNDLNVSLDLGARFGTVSGSRSVSLVVGDIHFGFLPGHSSGGTDGFHFIGNLTTGGQEHLGFQDMGFVPLAGKAGTTEDTAFNTIDVAISDAGTDYLFTYSITDGTNTYNNAISIAKTTVGDLDQLGIRTQTFGQSTTSSFDNFTVTQVPEPGSLALIALGGLCVLRRRRA